MNGSSFPSAVTAHLTDRFQKIRHSVCFRFTDGTLLIPVKELGGLMPEFNVRHDTNERDLVVRVNAMMFKRYWIDVVIKE